MFFTDQRLHFFRPLTGKYREAVVQCLRLLYRRQFSALADYGHHLSRQQILEIFTEALVQAPALEDQVAQLDEDHEAVSDRERAAQLLNRLIEHGWIEQHLDDATMQTVYRFSRMGRQFTQPLVDSEGARVHTRQRNTRNCKNSLRAFLDNGEVYELLDAWEFSERIISDFTDLITELEDRKRELVKDIEVQHQVELASEQFFDYMNHRFQPDISVRLSADSVEKHREEIRDLIDQIMSLSKEAKANSERRLRELLPELLDDSRQSLLWMILEGINQRLKNACEIMMPEIRRALQSYTNRADIIIRQMTWLASQQQEDIRDVCQQLNDLEPELQKQRLERAADLMTGISVGYLDPASLKMRQPRRKSAEPVFSEAPPELDQHYRKQLFIQDALDQAFMLNSSGQIEFLKQQLADGNEITTETMIISSAPDLLSSAHIIELGTISNRSSEYRFKIEKVLGREQVQTDYFVKTDNYRIQILEE
ncbi:Wadjet anti-phage system protein JetA family protein [Pelagibaculum spongiae]|uniref:Flagellar protein FliT n=1 Tax=Pelagibaculum spongiae TaxID=2080658 RepID=A0A2V1H0K7_9GAMM|nr:Wadjet anti-phage system protein JetA family protein [Pelagibaculum spongiae]PVZ72546.1 flagellar protein FliT [Pelagibaculum spongiae]